MQQRDQRMLMEVLEPYIDDLVAAGFDEGKSQGYQEGYDAGYESCQSDNTTGE